MANTMRAWQVMGPGPLRQTMQLTTGVARPTPTDLQPGQVLARVVYAALNPVDYRIPELGVAARTMASFPLITGSDMAGIIEAVGPDVDSSIRKGTSIMARIGPVKPQGTLAEYVVLDKGTWTTVAGVDLKEAAGSVTVALTALQSIKPYVNEGDKVFLNGGGGGLGIAGIQIAKLLGCHVTVSCSTDKIQLCKDLGADEVIDYKTTDLMTELTKRGADLALIVDNVGNSPTDLYKRSDSILIPSGAYIYVGARMSFAAIWSLSNSLIRPTWLGGQSRKFVRLNVKTVDEDLKQIAAWMAAGKLKTVLDSTFEFEKVQEAFDRMKTGKARGKVIVRVAGEKVGQSRI